MTRVNRRAFLKASGGVATIGLLAGCSADSGDGGGDGGDGGDGGSTGTPGDGDSGESITIGALEPISGPFAPWATPHRDGLQFAVEQINADGGVLGGRNLEVAVADTGADPAQADSSFRRQVEQEGVVATTGSVSSDVGLRVAQTAAELEVPHFLHMSGTNDVITSDTQFIFRVGLLPASSYIQAQTTAFAEAGYTKIGAIVADYAWGRAAEEAINEFFDVDVNIQVAPLGADDFSSQLRQMPSDLEMLITSGHPPGAVTMANQVYELGYSPETVVGAGTPPQLLIGALSDRALQSFVHTHNSDPTSDAFQSAGEAFAEGHDMQFNTHTAFGYATAQMIATAIDDVGETDPVAIADAVRSMQFDSLFAEPIQYSENGELDQTVSLYSHLEKEAPSYDPEGTHRYVEQFRSEPVPAREV